MLPHLFIAIVFYVSPSGTFTISTEETAGPSEGGLWFESGGVLPQPGGWLLRLPGE